MKVIFVELNVTPSSPTVTWASALSKLGVECDFVDPTKLSTIAWLIKLFTCDVVVVQFYGSISLFLLRQLSLAPIIGTPVVRKWSGTDVLNVIKNDEVRICAKEIDRITALNLSSEHYGLVEELLSVGISCELTSQVLNETFVLEESSNNECIGKDVLAYLPSSRREFYGFDFIRQAIERHPELTFLIVADTEHRLAHHANVESLGWVDEMEPIWNRTGLLIRITEHDGFPRMLLQALCRGRYVIHNQRFDGVWYASTRQEIDFYIEQFKHSLGQNEQGLRFAKKLLNSKGEQALQDKLMLEKPKLVNKVCALKQILRSFVCDDSSNNSGK